MKLSDFIVTDATIPELQATDRNGVIREMVSALAPHIDLSEEEAALVSKAVIQRENQGSTGFGKGVAVPHEQLECVKTMTATIGRSSRGVDFAALDRSPVYAVFLLLSPKDAVDDHVAAMEKIFRCLQREKFRRFLRQAGTHEEIVELVQEADGLQDD